MIFFLAPTINNNKGHKQWPITRCSRFDNIISQKYLPPSTAATKGHMHRFPENMKSTRKHNIHNLSEFNNHNDMMPLHKTNAQCEIYCFAALSDAHEKIIYNNLTGKLPLRSYQGNQYIFLAYVYDINTILVRPMKTRTAGDMKNHSKIYIHI